MTAATRAQGMRVFVAGASGAIGKQLVPLLLARGHSVVATTRSPRKAEGLRSAGAYPVVFDGFDRQKVIDAVRNARPDVVVHQLTSLAAAGSLRHWDSEFALTNRLRTEALDHLLGAASDAGVRRFLAQSYAGWPYARTGGPVKSETDPLDPAPPRSMRGTLEAIRHVESAVPLAGLEGIVLRYGNFYGPGTSISDDGVMVRAVRERKLPMIGDGSGVWSFVHVGDAAAATVAALERGAPGLYNVVDDEPAPAAVWLPELARIVGAAPPRRMPVWLARLAAGEAVVTLMTEARGASNAKARRGLGWQPSYPSWRDGFRRAIAAAGEPEARHADQRKAG
jgi:nucleoside-diphosphate-sugar epimerase